MSSTIEVILGLFDLIVLTNGCDRLAPKTFEHDGGLGPGVLHPRK